MKYKIQLKEIVTYEIEVAAKSADAALDLVNEGQFDGEKITERETYEFPIVLSKIKTKKS